DAQARDRVEPDGTDAPPVVEVPPVAVVAVLDTRGAITPFRRDALLPEVGRFVDVRVGVDEREVEVGPVRELRLHEPVQALVATSSVYPAMPSRTAFAACAVRSRARSKLTSSSAGMLAMRNAASRASICSIIRASASSCDSVCVTVSPALASSS